MQHKQHNREHRLVCWQTPPRLPHGTFSGSFLTWQAVDLQLHPSCCTHTRSPLAAGLPHSTRALRKNRSTQLGHHSLASERATRITLWPQAVAQCHA